MSIQIASKSLDTARTSTIAATADPDLQLSLLAGKTYRIHLHAVVQAGAAADFKWGLSTGGVALTRGTGIWKQRSNEMELNPGLGDPGSVNDLIGCCTESSMLAGTTRQIPGKGDSSTYVNNSCWIWLTALVQPSANCTLSFIWAQNTSSASEPAVVMAGSSFTAEEVANDEKRQAIFKPTAESRTRLDGATMFPDSDLVLPMEADTTYWFAGLIVGYVPYTYAARIWASIGYDAGVNETPRAPFMYRTRHTVAVIMGASSQANDELHAGVGNLVTNPPAWQIFNDSTSNSSRRGALFVEGVMNTDSGTPGDLSIVWRTSDNGYSLMTGTVHAGSWLMVEKLNPCTFPGP